MHLNQHQNKKRRLIYFKMKWSTIIKGEVILFTTVLVIGAILNNTAIIGLSILMLAVLTVFACVTGEK